MYANSINTKLIGVWQIDNVTYTFTSDTLYIDEINNEGDWYSYVVTNSVIIASNDYYEPLQFKIISVTDDWLTLFAIDNNIPTNIAKFKLRKIKRKK